MITLIGEITDEVTKDFIDELLAQKDETINILIDSIGGDVGHGLSIISVINILRHKGKTINAFVSQASSTALYIALACDKRYGFEFSIGLYHNVFISYSGLHNSFMSFYKSHKGTDDTLDDIILRRTKITKDELEEYKTSGNDIYFTSEEMLAKGIINEIIPLNSMFEKQDIISKINLE